MLLLFLFLFLFLASFEATGTRENLSFVCHVALCLFLVYVKRINQRPSPLRLNKAQTQPMHLFHRQPIKAVCTKPLALPGITPERVLSYIRPGPTGMNHNCLTDIAATCKRGYVHISCISSVGKSGPWTSMKD